MPITYPKEPKVEPIRHSKRCIRCGKIIGYWIWKPKGPETGDFEWKANAYDDRYCKPCKTGVPILKRRKKA